jgi:hypothetical protein
LLLYFNTDSNSTFNKSLETKQVQDSIDPLCDGEIYSLIDNLNPSQITSINIDIPDSADWYRNLFSAHLYSTERGNYINSIFKKDYNSIIEIIYLNAIKCKFDAEIRINGDLKDHIDINNLISSLDVKLKNGNILNITRFKLFLPETRRGDNEIFATSLLRNLDFLSPRSFYTNVGINGNSSHEYIFQEKISKEMLEYNKLREGPILETNERYVWETSEDSFFREDDKFSKDPLLFSRLINDKWGIRTEENKKIAIDALEKYNKSLFSSFSSRQLNNEYLNKNTTNLYMYEVANYALVAEHGVGTNHNRQFYFNKLSNEFIPSYYDGNPEFFENPPRQNFEYAKSENLVIGAEALLQKNINFENLYLDLTNSGLDLSKEDLKMYLDKFKNNVKEVIALNTQKNFSHPSIQEQKYKFRETGINFLFKDLDRNSTTVCNQFFTSCKESVLDTDLNIFNDDIFYEGNNTFIFGSKLNTFLSVEDQNLDNSQEIVVENFLLKNYNNTEIKIDKIKKIIDISINNLDQKILVTSNGVIKSWSFQVFNNVKETLPNRSDENLLTGCITFYNLVLEDVSVTSHNSHCEDSVNFLNVKGDVNKIEILDSTFDALDLDNSELFVKDIYVSNAFNDCVDVSNGKYRFYRVEISGCIDKSISIGEKSKVNVNKLISESSEKGIVVKDSSEVVVKNFKGRNIKTCVQIYRKKQEFGPSKLSVENYECEGENMNYIQKGSEFNDS